jgi:hypothetical protein
MSSSNADLMVRRAFHVPTLTLERRENARAKGSQMAKPFIILHPPVRNAINGKLLTTRTIESGSA